jgi:hypothetical protein
MEARGDTATAVGDYSLKLNFNALLSAGTPAGVDEGTVSTGTVVLKACELIFDRRHNLDAILHLMTHIYHLSSSYIYF